MKKVKTIFRVLMLIVFLTASLGVTIHRMACLYGCAEEISLSEIEDCCSSGEEDAGVFFEPACCDFSSASFILDDYSPSSQLSLNTGCTENVFFEPVNTLFKNIFLTAISPGFITGENPPYPGDGRDVLLRTRKFTI